MNRRLVSCLAATCLVWFNAAPLVHAADEFVILSEGNAFWTNNLNAPICQNMLRLQKTYGFRGVSFTSSGDWIVLMGGNAFYTSRLDLPACQKLLELQPAGSDFHCAAYAPAGGWVVFWNGNNYWSQGNVPDDAIKRIKEVVNDGGTLRSIALGPQGAWVLLFDETGISYGNLPDDLSKVLDQARTKGLQVRCVSFTTTGTWFCLANNGWWTNNKEHGASRMLAVLDNQRHALRWVAVAPELGPHDFQKWSALVRAECDGKLPGGYAYRVLHEGKVVAEGAEGWARAPWEKEHASVKWTLNKPMGVASVSKTITAVALLKLWEESAGKFSLDDPFWPHLETMFPNAHADVKQVTFRQLLQHKSGFKPVKDCNTVPEMEALVAEPLAHKPGTHGHYHNNNYYLTRLLIEQISKQPYTPYVKEHVLRPMGIVKMETHFQADQPTCGYGKQVSERGGFPFDWNCDASAGAAGWYASAADLSLFLSGLHEHKVLTAATTDMMYKDSLGWDTAEPVSIKNGGWFWNEGSAPGSRAGALRSAIVHFPDDVDAVMLINSDTDNLPENILQKAWLESMQP